MSRVLIGTDWVGLDEPCYSVKEHNGPSPDYKSLRRWQTVKVLRGDRIVEMRRDLGPAENFRVGEIAIPGGVVDRRTGRGVILHSVGELLEIADHHRAGDLANPDPPEPEDLVGNYYDLPDQMRKARVAHSTFGPKGVMVRTT